VRRSSITLSLAINRNKIAESAYLRLNAHNQVSYLTCCSNFCRNTVVFERKWRCNAKVCSVMCHFSDILARITAVLFSQLMKTVAFTYFFSMRMTGIAYRKKHAVVVKLIVDRNLFGQLEARRWKTWQRLRRTQVMRLSLEANARSRSDGLADEKAR
jgi:hypothetical protein